MSVNNNDDWNAWKNNPNKKRQGKNHNARDFDDVFADYSSRPDDIYSQKEYKRSEMRMNGDSDYDNQTDENNLSRRNRNSGAKKRKEKKKRTKKIIIAAAAVFCIAAIIGTGILVGMYAAVKSEIKDMNIQNLTLNQTSEIYYERTEGNFEKLESINGGNNRIYTENIPQHVKDALVSIEDERFYSHHGVDLKRTIGATFKYILSKIGIGESDYGGSTITQQVIKNITQEKDQSPSRKVKEMLRAIALEQELSKDEILTMYLNIVFFANGCYGIEAAAQKYYDKTTEELSIAEAASIVGITQTPARFDPIAHPDNNKEKRDLVLSKMLELNKISQEEYDEAVATPVKVVNSDNNSQTQVSSYFVDMVIRDIIIDLQNKKGYTESFATQQVYNGGLKIYVTMDKDIQETMEDIYESASQQYFPLKDAQSAMMILDPHTGEIKGVVGGVGKKTTVRGLNRAVQSRRPPGSAIKPLSVYTPALEQGKKDGDDFTEATILTDEARTFTTDDNKEWSPKNSYSNFYGDITAKTAMEISSNIAAASVLVDYLDGPSTSYKYLENNFHISTLDQKDEALSPMSLGGLTYGVTVKEMAAAYGVLANEGKYIEPHSYTQVLDASGQVILENKSSESQAIKASTAYIISDMLYEVVNGDDSHATGRAAKIPLHDTYGKTGTTNDNFDRWFVGYTSYYVGAVWYGYDEPQDINSSFNPSTRIFQAVMSEIHEDLDPKDLSDKPTNVVEEQICTQTGLKARSGCPSETFYFESGSQPDDTCSKHSGSSYSKTATPVPKSSSSQAPSSSTAPKDSNSTPRPMGSGDTDIPDATRRPDVSTNSGNGAPSGNNSSSGSSSNENNSNNQSSGSNSSNDSSSGENSGSSGDTSSGNESDSSSGSSATAVPSKR